MLTVKGTQNPENTISVEPSFSNKIKTENMQDSSATQDAPASDNQGWKK